MSPLRNAPPTDHYQLTMACGYWRCGRAGVDVMRA